jgi:peptidoglycan/LPS O-acetylase OafA/YrhL
VLETRLHEPDARRASRRPAAHRAAPAEPATVRAAAVTDAGGGAVRLRALDGLRLLVALMVAFFHYLGEDQSALAWGKDATRIFPDIDYLAPYGWLGVEIFFMISGFVICMSSWGRSVGAFFRSRICRLYPAYWAAVVLTFVVISLVPVLPKQPTLAEAIVNLTMFQNPMGATRVDGVYWTLWVELRFYLVFALVVWGGLTYRRVLLFCAAWTLLIPIASAADLPLLWHVVQPDFASYFLLGVGLYLLHRFGHSLPTWLLIGVNTAICLYRAEGRMHGNEDHVVNTGLNYATVALVLAAAMVFLVAMARGRLDWMSWKWLTVAGALTYPFYLLHQMIGYSMIKVLHAERGITAYVVLPGTVLAMLLLAWLVHRFVERPLGAVLKRQLSNPALLDPLPERFRSRPGVPRSGAGAR